MIEIAEINLRDYEYNDFDYETFHIIKTKDFEEKYEQLMKIAREYEDFQEVYDFINNNFITIDIDYRIVGV